MSAYPHLQMIIVLLVLAATFVCFVREWIPSELAALTGFASLLAFGILDEKDIGGVFGNAAPITIGAMFILSEALTRTGVIDFLATRFQTLARGSEVRALVFLALIVMPASAFLNNTPVVVVFLPIIIATCQNSGLKATRLLLPLSFLSILGGTATLLGTSTNLLVSGVAADAGQPAFTIFEITPLGLIYAAVGSLYMVFIGRHFLPAKDTLSSSLTIENTRRFYSAIEIEATSPLVGQRLVECPLLVGPDKLSIYQVVRQGDRLHQPLNQIEVESDDIYWVRASTRSFKKLRAMAGVKLLRRHSPGEDSGQSADSDWNAGEVRIVEAVIGPDCSLIGKTISRASLRQRYGILVAALHRRGRNMREDFENIPVEFGDSLILEGPTADIQRLSKDDDILSLQDLDVTPRLASKAPVAILALLSVVLTSAMGLLSITSAAIIGSVIVILFRCLSTRSAFECIDWKILFLIYGMLGIGRAMEKSGVALMLADGVTGAFAEYGPYLILAAVYLLASIMTELVTNNAVAIILTPIVIGIANSLGFDARPFIVAIMFGASASFITPIGYQTNTYVYAAGNYQFRDFFKIGIPLNLILAVIATILIPVFWPFSPR